MATKVLPENVLAFGRAFLLATDALGMSAEGAFWLHDPRDDEWRYFLITSLYGRLSTRDLYSRLMQALGKTLSERETTAFPFYIVNPTEKLPNALRKAVKTGARASAPINVRVTIHGKKMMAWVYRLSDGIGDAKAKTVQRRFKRLTKELMVA